jgi:hypothetical protein
LPEKDIKSVKAFTFFLKVNNEKNQAPDIMLPNGGRQVIQILGH